MLVIGMGKTTSTYGVGGASVNGCGSVRRGLLKDVHRSRAKDLVLCRVAYVHDGGARDRFTAEYPLARRLKKIAVLEDVGRGKDDLDGQVSPHASLVLHVF